LVEKRRDIEGERASLIERAENLFKGKEEEEKRPFSYEETKRYEVKAKTPDFLKKPFIFQRIHEKKKKKRNYCKEDKGLILILLR